jgi:uncharacterized Zn finger protein
MPRRLKTRPRWRRAQLSTTPAKGEVPTAEALRSFLSGQTKERLVGLLMAQTVKDHRLFRSLMVEMATRSGGGRVNLTAIRRALDAAFDTEDVDSYREVAGYARGLDEAIDGVESLLKQGHAQEVIELAEHALSLAEDALTQVDDSNGEVSGVLERLQELHLKACKKARPDPEELAKRLFAWEMRGDWDTFHGSAQTYGGVLGKQGLAVFRKLAEAEWAQIPARDPGGRYDYDARRRRITGIMESLAQVSGDLEAKVAVMARDLSSAYRFLAIAELYKQSGDKARALEWAEKGVRSFPKQTDARLRTFLANEYHARRRHGEAMALIWASFEDRPSLDSFRALKSHAEKARCWPEWREKAIGSLHDAAGKTGSRRKAAPLRWDFGGGPASTLVEILLWEKRPDEAWEAARRYGCAESLWLELAKAREGAHPEEAFPIYQRRVEAALRLPNGQGYEEAVNRLRQVHELMTRLGKAKDFSAYLAGVLSTHGRKRNFMRLLVAARLE